MKFNELPEQCQHCFNLQIFSLYMDGNHDYCCGKYPITKAFKEPCPKRSYDRQFCACKEGGYYCTIVNKQCNEVSQEMCEAMQEAYKMGWGAGYC